MLKETALDRLTIRRLAIEADVVEKTLRRRLRGEPVRGRAGERCDAVLQKAGIEPGVLGPQGAQGVTESAEPTRRTG